jgi:tRNA A-37 threonylcarbamoyl transferase component Bud32
MQRCPEPGCAHINRPSARFCEKCGRTLRQEPWTPLRSGHLLRGGAYRILEPMGRGGMGALYLAADQNAFDRRCVVKELLDYYDPTDADEARQAQSRFETEARLLAALSHPAMPRIYSYFSEAGRHYIVMEYIEGETLERAVTHADHLGRSVPARPLPTEEVVRHAVRACRVLEYLADRPTPVIHHDVKPANLIVDGTSGEVRLVDFGTAQARLQWATQMRLDPGGATLFGTEGYAAPEQYQGRSEPRSDVYALAATVYHLLTDDDPGEHPFHFPEMGTLPGPLADALERALRPEVGRRSTATEFRQALEAWLIPEDGGQPFVFRNGSVARTTEELAALCDRHWDEARQHLAADDFDRWFRARNRHDLVAKARSARLEPDADAALEAFLRRINPRLPVPRLVVQPQALDFGRLTRGRDNSLHLAVRNETRGYGQATFSASVPWLRFDPEQVGCPAGVEVPVAVSVNAASLPFRREQQAVVACTSTRGARISIPVTVQLDLVQEVGRRCLAGFQALGRLAQRGARRGLSLWTRAFTSLVRSRYGPWVLLAELLILAATMVALWWSWLGELPVLADWILIFCLALLAVYLLPALAFVGGAIVWEGVKSLGNKRRRLPRRRSTNSDMGGAL